MTSTPLGPPSDHVLEAIDRATARLLATVDGLPDADWGADTVLPDWTRAHVIAHLVLNAEGLAGVLHGLRDGVPTPMYASDVRRDGDIDELAGADAVTIRGRLQVGALAFADAVRAVPSERWSGTFDRLPGVAPMPAGVLPAMRLREVQIHHADLGAGFSHQDWPADFVADLLDTMAVDHAGSGPFLVTATDLARSWQIGVPDGGSGPEVTGTGAALGWWLVGREQGADLHCASGDLPTIGPWRRSPLRK
ncbi:MAG: maleylpyruvate isomerase family mycothiol-dependent enzyme [Marmoricola sp.]